MRLILHRLIATTHGMIDAVRRWMMRPGRMEIRRVAGREAVLGFGGVLDDHELVHGGAVKLLSLRRAFAGDDRDFNILYLVSSAQPRFAEHLVRACRRQSIGFVWNQNGVGYPGWAGAEAERHNAPMRRLRAQADHLVYQSEFCRSSAEMFLGPCAAPSVVLLNPVNLDKFHPAAGNPPRRPLRLLAMGTQNYRERALAAIHCLKELRAHGTDAELTLAGPLLWKNAAADLSGVAAELELGDVVRLTGPFRQEEAPEIYRAHHMLLHPKYLDPCPTVVAEALACGLPVVASNSGGLPEMVDAGSAELIDVPVVWDRLITPSGGELAQAAQRLLARYDAARLAARARAEAAFDARRWVARHREIFSSLLS